VTTASPAAAYDLATSNGSRSASMSCWLGYLLLQPLPVKFQVSADNHRIPSELRIAPISSDGIA
jgi:hypothetical protein